MVVFVQIPVVAMFALVPPVIVELIVKPHHAHLDHVKMVEPALTMAQHTLALVFQDTLVQIAR